MWQRILNPGISVHFLQSYPIRMLLILPQQLLSMWHKPWAGQKQAAKDSGVMDNVYHKLLLYHRSEWRVLESALGVSGEGKRTGQCM